MKAATKVSSNNFLSNRVSIHAAREGGDCFDGKALFYYDVSIHAAREGGDTVTSKMYNNPWVSIHAAREGGDMVTLLTAATLSLFQSTPPVKAATFIQIYDRLITMVSIHAAREGGDRIIAVK